MFRSTVSVIIPTYNRWNRLESTVKSVVNQSYESVEIIIVDDGSCDETASKVNELVEICQASTKTIRYIRQENSGACSARNRGMMHAVGVYLLFLDSDDLIRPNMLSAMVDKMESTGCQCVFCDFEILDECGNVIGYQKNNKRPLDFVVTLTSSSISAILIRRSSIPPGLQWNSALKRIQDIDFMYKYFFSVKSFEYIAEPYFQYVWHGSVRISDSYKEGVQYKLLRKSLRSYIEGNLAFVRDDWRIYYKTYCRRLLVHQIRNAVARIVPSWVRVNRGKGSKVGPA